ncbi:hypothetical protein C0995_004097, partial [Termitomyces sp. Mi166
MAALSQPVVAKKPNLKPLQPKEGITTASCMPYSYCDYGNLYVVQFLEAHPNATKVDCSAAWKACNAKTKK